MGATSDPAFARDAQSKVGIAALKNMKVAAWGEGDLLQLGLRDQRVRYMHGVLLGALNEHCYSQRPNAQRANGRVQEKVPSRP